MHSTKLLESRFFNAYSLLAVVVEGVAALDLEEAQVAVVLLEEAQEVLVAPVAVVLPWVEVHFLVEDRCMSPEAEVD